jgi:hypothetical protein
MTSTRPDTDTDSGAFADRDWREFTDRDAREDAIASDLATAVERARAGAEF